MQGCHTQEVQDMTQILKLPIDSILVYKHLQHKQVRAKYF